VYSDDQACPVLVQKRLKRERRSGKEGGKGKPAPATAGTVSMRIAELKRQGTVLAKSK
jgi:hypothetical protein